MKTSGIIMALQRCLRLLWGPALFWLAAAEPKRIRKHGRSGNEPEL